jgi:hypothetical protein
LQRRLDETAVLPPRPSKRRPPLIARRGASFAFFPRFRYLLVFIVPVGAPPSTIA